MTALRADRLKSRVRQLAADLSGMAADELFEESAFLALGFDSLLLTQFAAVVQKEFGVKTTFRQLMEDANSIATLAAVLDKALPPDAAPAPAPAPKAAPARPMPSPTPTVRANASVAGLSVESEGLAAVFQAQLALMRQQLAMLSGEASAAAEATVASNEAARMAPAEPPAPAFELPKGFGPQLSQPKDALTPSQTHHIARLVARYNARTAQSKARADRDRPHFADPRTAAGFNRLWKELVYPIVVERSHGAHLWDVDGNKYVDLLNGFGPNFFGHGAPFIVEALKEQLDQGFEVGPQTPRAGEAAKLFCEMTGMDRVSFVNTGSEAVQAAIRIARTATGRDKIVVFSGDYHGNFDEVLVRGVKSASGRRTVPMAPGIPFSSVGNVMVLDYGEESALDAIAADADDIAAVLVEPVQSRRPEFRPREFLHKLRSLTKEKGVVLVFDEVITGFRICPGGAQSYYGVEADIATYGKIIGGGMPIGVVAGRAAFMDTFDGGQWRYGDDSAPTAGVTFFAGTFVRHPLAIAAVHASLSYLKAAGPALQESVNRKTTRLAEALNAFFAERGVKIFVAHFASQMFIRVSEESDLATLFFHHLRDRGVHALEGFPSYVTAAHTDEDIAFVVAAAKDAILEMQDDGILPVRAGVAAAARRREFPLTDGQREIWITAQFGRGANCALSESDAIAIEGPLDRPRFVRSFEDALNAAESFRLRFAADGSSQWVDPSIAHRVAEIDLAQEPPEKQAAAIAAFLDKEASSPFDLESGPLVRAHLVRKAADSHLLILYAHHIAFDGYSADLLLKDAAARYETGEGLARLAPYSVYAAGALAAPEAETGAYWRAAFAEGAPPPLDLPTDRPYGPRRFFEGATARGTIEANLARGVKETAKSLGVGAAAMTLAAYGALLSRLSGQDDFVVGVPAAGQADRGVETIGYCVNMLPIRLRPTFDMPFADLCAATQKALVAGMERQGVRLSELARDLRIPRSSGRAPLIQNVFNYSGYFAGVCFGEATASAAENARAFVHHELFINLTETADAIAIDWDYATALYDADTIERWIAHFRAMLADIAARPQTPIGALAIMAAEAREGVVLAMRRG